MGMDDPAGRTAVAPGDWDSLEGFFPNIPALMIPTS
jgi:hypothetical protein